jgi:hypothetical protein
VVEVMVREGDVTLRLSLRIELLLRRRLNFEINNIVDSKMKLQELTTPAFLVSEQVVTSNCQKLISDANKRGLATRPHMKTHKTMYVSCPPFPFCPLPTFLLLPFLFPSKYG